MRHVVIVVAGLAAAGFAGARFVTRAGGGPCPRVSDDAEALCYRRLFSQRLAAHGVADAAATLDSLSAAYPAVSRRAHEYAHGIGIEAYARFPDIAASFAACGERASSGCRHGIIQAYFEARERVTTPDVEALCRPFKGPGASRWVLFQCVHGMGHGLTMFHGHDLPRALEDCDRLADGWDRESCYGGAFMESDMNAIAPHHPASELAARSHHEHSTFRAIDPADPLYPCSIVAARHLRACYEIQTSVILYLNHGDIAKAARTCDSAPANWQDPCYQSLGRDITAYALRDARKSASLCAKGRESHQPACYVGVAKALVDWQATTDNALTFCGIVAPNGAAGKADCYRAVGEQIAALSADAATRAVECGRASDAGAVAACRRGAQLP